MSNIELTKKEFKSIASGFHTFSKNNPDATLGQFQQQLSQLLYSKPYEEVEKTILTGLKTLPVFSCNGINYIFRDERFVVSTNEQNEKELLKIARKNKIKCDKINWFNIPEIDDVEEYLETYEYNLDENGNFDSYTHRYVLKVARNLGYLSERSFVMDSENSTAFKLDAFAENGEHYLSEHSNDHPCGDWENNFTQEGFDALFMIIEINNQDGLYEYYLNVKDIENAKYNVDEKAWYLSYEKATLRFTFLND